MKKITLILMLLAILTVSCLVFTACVEPEHTCSFGEWEVAKRATCTQEGLKERFCSCGEKQTTTIASTGHSYASVETAPTCGEQGFTTHTCANCKDSYVDTYVDATEDHSYSAVVTPPTCTKQGFTVNTCAGCGDRYVDTYVDALGHDEIEHDAQAPTCTKFGWDAYVTCSRCNYSTYTSIRATGHSHEAIVTEQTCTEQGYTTYTCHCGDSYISNYVKASGTHNFQESDVCDGCEQNIEDAAIADYDMSDTLLDNVAGYIVPRSDGKYDVYIKGVGAMKAYGVSPFENDAYPLADVYVANGVTNISSYAFADCDSLTSITIPSSVKSIDSEAFYGCDGLKSVAISDGVQSIGSLAFESCKKLTSITIPSSVTSIGKSAFLNCSNLANITIEGSPRIGADAFTGTAYYKGDNWQNKVLYIDNCLIEAKSVTTCVVNEGTTVIADSAFSSCTTLTNITIPESVTIIGKEAFSVCTNLTTVTFTGNSKLTNLDSSVFYLCTNLKSITIPEGVASIGYHAFYGCSSIESITIPESVTSIGYQAFIPTGLKNVMFAAPSGWYVAETEGATSGTKLTLTNTSTNATYLKSTYANYYWYRNN